jgi:RNA polymerase sigma factor (sigma-70 family)
MAANPDRELVLLARQGDHEAFNQLIERYQREMERVALRVAGVLEAAQDIVQEAMLQAYLSLDDLRNPASYRSWLYSIVLNRAKSYLRSRKRMNLDGNSIEHAFLENSWYANSLLKDPQQSLIERELHEKILQAVDGLPPAHRETARLYYYESLTLQEIAAITGASPGAIKVRLHRARNQLRKKLQGTYPEMGLTMKPIEKEPKMTRVEIFDIIKRDEKYIVILKVPDQETYLPIWIGAIEGNAIAMGLRAFPIQRPMTFDFIVRLLETFDAVLEEVRVETLKHTTFYGIAQIRMGDKVKPVDARPSDVIALAVRTGSPILVAEGVLETAGIGQEKLTADFGEIVPGEGVNKIVEDLEQKLKQMMAAISGEEE